VVRRIDGRSLGTFFRDEVSAPLGLDFWIGLPDEHEARVAPTIPAAPIPGAPLPAFYESALTDPTSVGACVLMNSGAVFVPGWIDAPATHRAELPAFGGIANARALAGMYRPLALGGAVDGVRLVDRDTLQAMRAVAAASACDATLLAPTRFSLGFVKSVDNREAANDAPDGIVMTEDAFGHVGMGGSVGFCDPVARLSFGYTMNRQGLTTGLDERGQSLVDATYASLGYTRPQRGSWYR
jgi:CubicO group peptidase (beta-lactamase class C family)